MAKHTKLRGIHNFPPISRFRVPEPPVEIITDIDGNIYTYVTIGTQQWMVENLKTTKYADGTPIPNLTINDYNDWFLPSKDELNAMYTELYLQGVGGFDADRYWSSSEKLDSTSWNHDFNTGVIGSDNKTGANQVRACRAFTSATNYNLRDLGQAGGLIFWKSGNDYLEAAPTDQSTGLGNAWSNVDNLLIGTTGTAIGTGQANTTAIIGQVGHTDSAAKLCDDLSAGGWLNDTTGAYCYYNNDIANKADYGALYNWYAVDNAHGLAPAGWRVPSVADMNTLIAYIGGVLTGGGALKEYGLEHWTTPNTGATDDYGFEAVGGGLRSEAGIFGGVVGSIKDGGYFYASDNDGDVYSLSLSYNSVVIDLTDFAEGMGFSVRCMRDVV